MRMVLHGHATLGMQDISDDAFQKVTSHFNVKGNTSDAEGTKAFSMNLDMFYRWWGDNVDNPAKVVEELPLVPGRESQSLSPTRTPVSHEIVGPHARMVQGGRLFRKIKIANFQQGSLGAPTRIGK